MNRKTKFVLALVAAIPPLVGGMWALATRAAESVISPHMADAKQRVHIMCKWAEVQNFNTTAICDNLGVKCKSLDARVLVESGCEEDSK